MYPRQQLDATKRLYNHYQQYVYSNTFWTTQGVGAITVSESTVRPDGDTFTEQN